MEHERKFFGTDGVRDLANQGNMTPEFALKLGRAFIKFNHGKRIVVGRDTRISGQMLESALCSGMSSEGAEIFSAGIIPTPGISYAIKAMKADGGAVISASHNPSEYNGIKFLGSDGCKLSDEEEFEIENLLEDTARSGSEVGNIHDKNELVEQYAEHIASYLKDDSIIDDVVFDCASGASAKSVPVLVKRTKFSRLNTHIISREFNGLDINKNCGVMYMKNLTDYVIKNKMSVGFAFDGDADRVLISDGLGRIIDGDIILWVLGRWLSKRKTEGSDKVVVTVMSNMALETHLANEGIKSLRCPVGDRYVLETMRRSGAALGGEQSGHIIASEFTGTGDGLCTAVLFLNAVKNLGENISTLTDRFGRYPQKLTNIRTNKNSAEVNMKNVNEIVDSYREKVKNGRIFVRMSGTEPLLRILVEDPDKRTVDELSEELSLELKKFC